MPQLLPTVLLSLAAAAHNALTDTAAILRLTTDTAKCMFTRDTNYLYTQAKEIFF